MTQTFDNDDVIRLRVALSRIARLLDRQSQGASLTRTQASVLATVSRLGSVRLSDLADAEGVNPTMLSRIVAKLEDRGLLRRSTDPDDRRVVHVECTDAGTAEHLRVRNERTELLRERLTGLSEASAAELLAALPALESLADQCSPHSPRKENR
ncbi:MarR family winged helix-turn-helix transcriptional regulator [Pseudonocardia sp. CA-142604]|uniref:MarR family winged helix-turn-helix transcriptional regulator n=1 Tax=Pseudonocardia sp. CA-142604 TaxID=3240024 RepID=UPI003D8AC612